MRKIAFTLVELLVVVIIVGVLATLGLVNYTNVKEHALGKEAQANLKLIAAAEKIYQLETGVYYPTPYASPSIAEINTNLKLSLPPTSGNWAYSITAASASNFTALADRSGSGGYLECQYKITETGGEPVVSQSPCP
jgi:prepilin-type N-terminal cleavage/methylation domain-containing protein